MKRSSKLSISFLTGLAVLAGTGYGYQRLATAGDRRRFPPPGKIVDVGNFYMHIKSCGDGQPTVVLESGSGGFSLDWMKVQTEISKVTRVCSYDRAGHGWSQAHPHPHPLQNIVMDLHTLLVNSGQKPPYLLVGYSLGGLYMQCFARRFPDETAGVLLIDAAHPQMYNHLPVAYQRHNRLELYKRWLAAQFGLMRLGILRDPQVFSSENDRTRAALMLRPAYWRTMLDQNQSLRPGVDRMMDAAGAFPPVPLVVLTPSNADWLASIDAGLPGLWQEFQARLACLSPKGRLITNKDSDHSHLIEHPSVVQAILETITIAQEPNNC